MARVIGRRTFSLTNDQRSLIVAASALLGGAVAGTFRQNAVGGAGAASNESLYNSTNNLDDLAHDKDLIPLEAEAVYSLRAAAEKCHRAIWAL